MAGRDGSGADAPTAAPGPRRAGRRTTRPVRGPVREGVGHGRRGRARAVPALDGLIGDRRGAHALRPRPAPPGPLLRGREAPDARTRPRRPRSPRRAPTPRRRRPASGSPPLARATVRYRSSQRRGGRGGAPGDRGVVGVPGGHHTARPAHAPHLPQRRDRIGQVLEDLVGVHDVEGAVVEGERVHVADLEGDRSAASSAAWPRPGDTSVARRRRPPGPARPAAARSRVIVPGPHPTSSTACPGRRCGSRYAAEFSAVRQRVRPQHALVVTVRVGVVGAHAASVDGPDRARGSRGA